MFNNISFCANLIVDDSLYNKMPANTPKNYTEDLVNEYKKFIDNKVIKEITKGDTVELYKAPYNRGFAIGMRFHSNKLQKPFETGIYTNKKTPEIKPSGLVFQTMLFLTEKSGIKQSPFEPHIKTFKRAVKALLDENNNK